MKRARSEMIREGLLRASAHTGISVPVYRSGPEDRTRGTEPSVGPASAEGGEGRQPQTCAARIGIGDWRVCRAAQRGLVDVACTVGGEVLRACTAMSNDSAVSRVVGASETH